MRFVNAACVKVFGETKAICLGCLSILTCLLSCVSWWSTQFIKLSPSSLNPIHLICTSQAKSYFSVQVFDLLYRISSQPASFPAFRVLKGWRSKTLAAVFFSSTKCACFVFDVVSDCVQNMFEMLHPSAKNNHVVTEWDIVAMISQGMFGLTCIVDFSK